MMLKMNSQRYVNSFFFQTGRLVESATSLTSQITGSAEDLSPRKGDTPSFNNVKTETQDADDVDVVTTTSSPTPDCCKELAEVECRLETKELWDKFHELGTEMIITKTGR